jgi:4-hydroxy-tetrahydrodipicolinate synthase
MDLDALRARFAGVVAIPVTPFEAEGGVDRDALVRVLRRLVDGGITTVTPNGNTGEFFALETAEARQVLEVTMATVGDSVTVMAGVGGPIPQAIAAARHAQEHGAQAIMVHQPPHPFLSRRGWIDYHAQIANAVPELGLVTYLRNPSISGAEIDALAASAPNFAAVKYAVPDPTRFAAVKQESTADLTWIAGLAEPYAPGYFAYGATGFTSGLANVAPHISLHLLDALTTGDREVALQVVTAVKAFEELRAVSQSQANVSVVKEALAQLGVCRRDVRPPISEVPEAERATVAAAISGWDSLFVTEPA